MDNNQKDKLVSSYETLFICDLSLGEAAVKALVDKFIGMITDNGTLTGVNEWGKRRLAYPINDLNEGYYVLATFNAPHDFPTELERVFNITEGIMRSMVIKTEDSEGEAVTYQSKLVSSPAEVVLDDDEAGNPPKSAAPAAAPVQEAPAAAPVEEAPAAAPAEEAPAATEAAPAETTEG